MTTFPAERAQLRGLGPSIPFPWEEIDQTIPARFARIARTCSERVAVLTPRRSLTYAELDLASDRLASRILRCGRGGDRTVALLLEEGCRSVVAILAVLKAGRTCVPLDPSYPRSSLSFILADSQASLIVTDAATRPLADALARDRTAVVVIEEVLGDLAIERPCDRSSSEAPAFLLYTSGSTGRPKGVIQTHRNLIRYVAADTHHCGFSADDCISQFHSLSFSAGIGETLCALLNGASLFSYRVAEEGLGELAAWFDRASISVLIWIPTAFRYFLDSMPADRGFPTVRLVGLGSETVTPKDVEAFRAHFPADCQIVNRLGTTETGNYRLYFIDNGAPIEATVPAGYAVADKEVVLLGESGERLGFGEVGEIAIRGRYNSPGYWNRPELTRAAFDDDLDGGGIRTYRTGDLGMLRPDGCLFFRGRKDFQVKVRGVRIEVEEIESALLRMDDIRDAAVVARCEDDRDSRLVGYIVPAHHPAPSAALLRARLRLRLPGVMVPSSFEVLDVLPVTTSGKIDRGALQALERPRHEPAAPGEPNRSPDERAIAEIWSEVLGIETIGIDDDFFDLGGHSLSAVRVRARLRDTFGVDVAIRTLFEAPTVAGLAAAVQLARCATAWRGIPRIEPCVAGGVPALSFAQLGLWFIDFIGPGCTAYNEASAFRISGPLDEPVLRRALGEVVRRHQVLRTLIGSHEGRPSVILAPDPIFAPRTTDLRDTAAPGRETAALRLMNEEANRPFRLASDLPLRAILIRLDDDEYRLVVTIHHIACDGWSFAILRHELTALYNAFRRGEPSPLAELPFQYGDYAAWERRGLIADEFRSQLDYWRRQLDGLAPSLDLPFDRMRPAVSTFRGARRDFALSARLADDLRAIGRHEGATLFMTLLAGFQTLLNRYTGQTDIAVGTPVAGRASPELEGLIGCFINMVVMRGDLAGDPTFSELIGRVRELALAAFAHQDVPFEWLVKELHPDRDLGRQPLFQVAFILQNTPNPPDTGDGLKLTPIDIARGGAKFDLTLALTETGDGLRGSLEYSTDLFDEDTAVRFVGHLTTLLHDAAANPNHRLSELRLLSESERLRLVAGWNDTAEPYPSNHSLADLFERQLSLRPQATALEFGGKGLAYHELDTRADRLARRLNALATGPNTPVGLCASRSAEMVIGLLGILKSGGAYVPLDATYPLARLDFMIADAGVSIIVTERALERRLSGFGARLVFLDDVLDAEPAARAHLPIARSGPDDLAYIIYTSGSTGRPKGVRVTQRAVANLLESFRKMLEIGPDDVLLAVSSLSFDISALELLLPLVTGGRVAVVDAEATRDGDRLATELERTSATVMQATPATWRILLGAGWILGRPLKIICGGETMQPDLAEQLLARSPEVWNVYGPTETTIWSTAFRVRSAEKSIPIGRPIGNTTVHLLDSKLGPVAVGLVGEIVIGGVGVSRGYLNRPDLTAERFVPDPFSQTPGAMLYKTGDLARRLNDGNIVCLGRLDHQVKVRGHRIELEEIEIALLSHPQIAQASVMSRVASHNDRRLVAYVVPEAGSAAAAAELRGFLSSRIPEYMIPSGFVSLSAFPLTPAGKIDRIALQDIEPEPTAREEVYVAPRDELERRLVGLWEEVFGKHPIGVLDDFFHLGGDSLLAVRIFARMKADFAAGPSVSALFQSPTIAQVAVLIRDRIQPESVSSVVRVQRDGSKPPFFVVPGVFGVDSAYFSPALTFTRLARLLGPDQGLYTFSLEREDVSDPRLLGPEPIAAILLEDLVRVQPRGPYFLAGYSIGGLIALEMARQLQARGASIGSLLLFDTFGPGYPRKRSLGGRLRQRLGLLCRNPIQYIHIIVGRLLGRARRGASQARLRLGRAAGKGREADFDRLEALRLQIAILRACDAYRSTLRGYPGRLTLLRATERPYRVREAFSDPKNGWGTVVQGEVDVIEVAGNHGTIFQEPAVVEVAAAIKDCLRESQSHAAATTGTS